MRAQAFAPERPIERFDEGVIRRLARPGEVDLHLVVMSPQIQRLSGELAAVVPCKRRKP